MNLREAVVDAATLLENAREAIKQRITDLPDNPRIHRLTPKAFIIRFKDLGDNWSPEHHNFQLQYVRLNSEIDRRGLASTLSMLEAVVDVGWIRDGVGQKFTFHDDVRKYIGALIDYPFEQARARVKARLRV